MRGVTRWAVPIHRRRRASSASCVEVDMVRRSQRGDRVEYVPRGIGLDMVREMLQVALRLLVAPKKLYHLDARVLRVGVSWVVDLELVNPAAHLAGHLFG